MPLFQLHPDYPDVFPPTDQALDSPPGLLAVGGDLEPRRLLAAYRAGVFPWFNEGEPVLWWSPPERCVLPAERLHVARRFARWLRSCPWEISVDQDFDAVMAGCAEPRKHQQGTWIGPEMRAAYGRLHAAGYAHSIEVRDQGELIGGLYGVSLAGVYYAESMYSQRPQASKVALLALCRQWQAWGLSLIDVQMETAHLRSLGAVCVSRGQFEQMLAQALSLPAPTSPWSHTWSQPTAARAIFSRRGEETADVV